MAFAQNSTRVDILPLIENPMDPLTIALAAWTGIGLLGLGTTLCMWLAAGQRAGGA
jgi:hypothetical protein